MSDSPKIPGEELPPEQQEEEQSYTPTSPFKRVIAWMAVVYMVLIVLLNLYPFFHQGEYLYGVFPLLVCPAGVGLFVLAVLRLRMGLSAAGKAAMVLLAVVSVLLFVMGLTDGLPYLIAGLGG